MARWCTPSRGWLLAGLLLIVAAVLAGAAHLVFWWPCLGAAEPLGCAARSSHWLTPPFMADPGSRVGGVAPALAVSSLLAGLAWAVAVLACPLRRRLRVAGLIAAIQPVSMGLWSVVSAYTTWIDPELRVSRLWWVSGEVLALTFVAVMFVLDDDPELVKVRGWLAVVLAGATTYGMIRWTIELLAFHGNLGKGTPDPGAGTGMVVVLLVTGLVTVVHALLRGRRRSSTLQELPAVV